MRKHRSIGEIISTVTFIGCGLVILPYSMGLLEQGENVRGYIGLISATLCFLGGLRFTIANLFAKWRGD